MVALFIALTIYFRMVAQKKLTLAAFHYPKQCFWLIITPKTILCAWNPFVLCK